MNQQFRLFFNFCLFAVIMLLAPFLFSSSFAITTMSLMGVMIIFALSYNMLLGQTGLLSFGHAVYFGLAGFCSMHVIKYVGSHKIAVSLPFIPLIGALSGLFFGALFGSVSTRRAGTVFSMISLGLGELVAAFSGIQRSFFGGEEGINIDRTKLLSFFGYNFGPQIQVYFLIAFWCFVSVILMYAITRTPFGRMCNAVRDNPERAEFVGYSTQRVRFQAFVLSAVFAGIAGSLSAINFELVNSQSLGATQSGSVLLMTYIGGVGNFLGPILGAVLITFLQISLSDITKAWLLYFGLMFILVVMFLPGGLVSIISVHMPLIKKGRILRLIPSYLLAFIPFVCLIGGAVLLIELTHHLLVETASGSSKITIFKIQFDCLTAWPWMIAGAMIVVGSVGLNFLLPLAKNALGLVNSELAKEEVKL